MSRSMLALMGVLLSTSVSHASVAPAGIRALHCHAVNALGTAEMNLDSQKGVIVSEITPTFGFTTTTNFAVAFVNQANAAEGENRAGELGLQDLNDRKTLWSVKFNKSLRQGPQNLSGTLGRYDASSSALGDASGWDHATLVPTRSWTPWAMVNCTANFERFHSDVKN